MPRIYKGTETILKLYVHQCEVGDINTLRIALFTDTVDNSVEFYSDNMSVDGDTVFLRVNAWSFDMMNDGVINYIAHIESGEETFITERQSNYFLKTPTAYEPTITPNMDNYYTKGEVDELLENVEGGESDVTKEYVDKQDADLWNQLKLTEDKYIGVRSGDSSYGGAIKDGNIIFNFTTINGESILGTKDITIQGGEGGSATGKIYEYGGDWTVEDVYNDYLQGIPVFIKKDNQYGIITDVSNANGQIRLNGLFGDASGDAKPLRFECGGPRRFATWQMAFQESITSLTNRISNLENNGGGGSTEVYDDCLVLQYVGDYTVDFDGTSVEYNYAGSERQQHNIQVIQKVLSGEAKSVYYQYLHEQVYRNDEDGYNNKPTWLMMPMVYRYPSHDGIARFMGVINKDEWGGKHKLYAVGIMMRESNASIYQYNESWINLNSGGGSVDLSDYYTKGEVDDIISNIEIPEGGDGSTSDPDSYIIYLPEDYSEDTYTFEGEFVNSEQHGYWGSDRMEHNAQVIQAINEGKVKSVYLQRIREYFQVSNDGSTYTSVPIFMYVPMQFRQKNEIVDTYTRIFGYYALSEDDNNSIYLVGYNFEDDGSASLSIDRSYELEQSGGSGGGGDYPSEPTFNSMTVYNESRFGQDTDIDGDVSYYIAANIKSPRASIRRLWTENIHLGYDTSGEIGMLKFVHPFYSGSGNVNGEEVNDVYAMIDNQGNIYEGETKLSDKYVLKSDYDALLARVEALENN